MKKIVTDFEVAKKLLHIKASAAKRELEFNVSIKKMRELLKRKTCAYTGIPFGGPMGSNHTATVDRIDSAVGYIDSNIVMCSNKFNSIKSSYTNKELLKIMNAITKMENVQSSKRGNVTTSNVVRRKKA